MKTKKLIKALLGISFLTLGMVTVNDVKEVNAAETTASIKTFTATSGKIDSVVSYSTAKGGGTSAPAVNTNQIRLYQGAPGGNVTISVTTGYYLKSVTITSAMKTTLKYTVGKAGDSTTYLQQESISANGSYSVSLSNTSTTDITVHCFGSDKNSRLYLSSITAIYDVAGGGTVNSYSVTFDSNEGSAISSQTVLEDGYVSEPVAPTRDGYDFLGWYTDETWTTPWDFETMAITKDTTIYARWQVEDPNQPKWALVTDVADLAIGGKYIITSSTSDYAMSTEQKTNNRGAVAVISKDGVIKNKDLSSNVQQFTLESGTVADTYAFNTGSGYIYAAGSDKNYLKTQQTIDVNSSWTISVSEEGVASVVAKNSSNRNVMQYNYNNGSPLFNCYSSASQAQLSLYKYFDPSAAYTVSFVNYEGGTEVAAQSVAGGGKVNQPAALTREGYTFGGWYTDAAYSAAWDFANDTVSGDITLYAKWTNDACEENVKTYNGFANLAYKYTVTEQTYEAGYVKVTNASEIKDGSKIIVVSVVGENRYALTGATDGTPKNSLDCVSVSADENGYLTSHEGASEWTVSGSATDGYTLFDGTKYLTADADDTPLYAKETASDVKFNIVCAGENSYLTTSGEHAVMYRNEPETNGEYFKHYKLANIGKTGYASNVELYVENSDTTTKTIYSGAEFRLQVGVNAAEMSSLLATLPAGAKYGIEVTAPVGIATQKQFTQEELEQKTSTDEATSSTYNYTVISLKDVMNNLDRATVVFTVKVFVELEGQIYYSDIAKEYSVASMVKAYYDTGDTRVSGLYNVLLENGIYNDAVEA